MARPVTALALREIVREVYEPDFPDLPFEIVRNAADNALARRAILLHTHIDPQPLDEVRTLRRGVLEIMRPYCASEG